MNAFVLKRRAAIRWEKVHRTRAISNAALNVFHRGRLAFQISFHHVVVLLNSGFNQLLVILFNVVNHISWHVYHFEVLRQAGVVPDISFLGENINHTYKAVFTTNRQCHDQRVCAQYFLNLVYHANEVSTNSVQLVDKDNSCNFGFVSVAPVGL